MESTTALAEAAIESAQFREALAAHRAGDAARAHDLCAAVLSRNPQQADALHLLGLLAQQAGDATGARALIEASIEARPNGARAHFHVALIYASQNDVAGAIAAYEAAVVVNPQFAEAHCNLGNLYGQTGRQERALRAYSAAIQAQPDFAAAYCNLATVLIELGRYDIAIRALEAALRIAPDMPEARTNLAEAYRRSGRLREALHALRRALELRPDRDGYRNLAFAANAIGDVALAGEATERATELEAASADGQCNLAWHHLAAGRYAEAIVASEAAIARRPDFAEAHMNLAVSLLVRGEFARGWDEYAWLRRLPAKRAVYPYLDRLPLWNGEDFSGRRLLIARDQGFGDAIQLVRYLPAVRARGGRVVLETSRALVALFTGLPGVDELRIPEESAIFNDGVDLVVPLSDLPRIFGTDLTSLPGPIPYLRAPAERVEHWRARLERTDSLRVGIVWAGNPNHEDDAKRSVQLADFAALGAIDGVAWFGLQKGRDEHRRSGGSFPVEPLGAEIVDFADTAAIITHLDLVISVDTSIVHLAGAMGKPVWTLLPFVADWRWLLERRDSPWYPTVRLFRQPRAGDWASVFGEVARELVTLRAKSTL